MFGFQGDGSLGMGWVIVLYVLTAGATVSLAVPRIGKAGIKKLLWLVSGVIVGGGVLLALADFRLLAILGAKESVMDWLSPTFLLGATVVAALAAARLHRQGRPTPIGMTLAVGLAWAQWREVHYGGDFTGHKFWFTQNLLRLKAYMSDSYFEEFRRSQDIPYDVRTLYLAHVLISLVVWVVALALLWYVLRHRSRAIEEARSFYRSLPGRLFFMGAGLYVAAEILGGILHRTPHWGPFSAWTSVQNDFWHTAVEESLECWGAITCLLCATAFWQAVRRDSVRNGEWPG